MAKNSKPLLKTCFVLAPIDESGSPTRERSDAILNYVIRPVCHELGYSAIRADEFDQPGSITKTIIIKLVNSDLVIADLTDHNPNVFYELAVRHMTGKPLVQLIKDNERIPFDVQDINTIKINTQDISSVEQSKVKLANYIQACEKLKFVNNPLLDTIQMHRLEFPILDRDPSGVEDALDIILKEFKDLRSDRSRMVQTMFEPTSQNSKHNVSGTWQSNLGLVNLIQSGSDIFGRYQLYGDT